MRRPFLAILPVLALLSAPVRGESTGASDGARTTGIAITNAASREGLPLDGEWRAIVDPYDAGRIDYRGRETPHGYFLDAEPAGPSDRVEYDFDTSMTLRVPGDWNTQRAELFLYEGPVWYRRRFDLEPHEDKRYFLHFGGANHTARVYLDGKPIGEHEGGFTPFAYEVTDHVKSGVNTLVVEVDNTRRRDAVPTLMTDWWNYGGITRPVRLLSLPRTFIRDYSLVLDNDRRRIRGWVQLDGTELEQTVTVALPEAQASVVVRSDASGRAVFELEAELTLWRPENPHLYRVEIDSETDSTMEAIGFRTVEVRGRDILLNGEPVFLRGVSVHEEAPFRGGRAVGVEDARTLLGWVKELGGNFVRLAHYPHNEAMVREADRMGVLVWSEIPVYWTISWENPATLASAKRQLAESIERDRNRAAVILWSVANETPVSEPRNVFLAELVATARTLDPSRLLTAALEAHYEAAPEAHSEGEATLVIDDPIGAELDVMGTNEYIGWYDGLPEKCDRVSWRTPYDKPLVMSEFGGGALAGRHGGPLDRWSEEYQESLYEHQIAMLERIPFLRGTTPWILMDFRSPRRPLPVIQDFWNRKGLVSERGERKKAFYTLQAFYRRLAGASP